MFGELPADFVQFGFSLFVREGFVLEEVGAVRKELMDGVVVEELGFAGLLEFNGAAVYAE